MRWIRQQIYELLAQEYVVNLDLELLAHGACCTFIALTERRREVHGLHIYLKVLDDLYSEGTKPPESKASSFIRLDIEEHRAIVIADNTELEVSNDPPTSIDKNVIMFTRL